MYSLRASIRLGLLIGAGCGLLTEALIAMGTGRPGTVQMLLRGAFDLVRTVPLG